MTDTKPTTFKNGVPAEQSNGFFGLEEELMADPSKQVTAVVTFEVDDIVHKELTGDRYPVVKIKHIEPIREEKAEASVLKVRDAAYKKRTGENALDLPEVDD
ncbi:hypothetical protein QE428_002634 [Microbacterium sp. SORGH_AS 505]|uniref:hypothetical protein n=1 Tax=Microbacterium sp. SORGH_AS_0505 TaxID=3041770 RepID=UPI002785CF84|nr:hypothetical protein [Microbacterium sp. SORGH_AS_0505]MDQ1127601.1 hypothetical protein [Microbacterium sp. SORGH_AS_0505]